MTVSMSLGSAVEIVRELLNVAKRKRPAPVVEP